MSNPHLPEPFSHLRALTDQPESLEQAKDLTEILNTIPMLQSWLRAQRQRVVRTLHERDGVSYTSMAPHLGVTPERVSGIARGQGSAATRSAD